MSEPLPTRRSAIITGSLLAFGPEVPAASAPEDPKRIVIEGYTDQLSYAPGDEVKLHLSSSEKLSQLLRVGRVTAKGLHLVVPGSKEQRPNQLIQMELEPQTVPKDASSHGCRWPISATFRIGDNWTSGVYRVMFSAGT